MGAKHIKACKGHIEIVHETLGENDSGPTQRLGQTHLKKSNFSFLCLISKQQKGFLGRKKKKREERLSERINTDRFPKVRSAHFPLGVIGKTSDLQLQRHTSNNNVNSNKHNNKSSHMCQTLF